MLITYLLTYIRWIRFRIFSFDLKQLITYNNKMFSWLGVHSVTPTGLRLSRAWHFSQFSLAMIPPLLAYLYCEFVWKEEYKDAVLHVHNTQESMKNEVRNQVMFKMSSISCV